MKKRNISKQLHIEVKNPHESFNPTSKKKNTNSTTIKLEDISSGNKSEFI